MKWRNWIGKASPGELDEEMRFHIEQHAARLMRQGLREEDAMRQARVEFGSVAGYREECREAKGLMFLDGVRADLQFAVRVLRRQPGLSATAILFLAVAVGANTAFFGFVNTYGFRLLPVRGAERHFDVVAVNGRNDRIFGFDERQVDALSRQASQVADLYTVERLTMPLVDERVRRAAVEVVSPNFFPLLGGVPNPEGAVLSHAGWQRLFGGDPGIVGKRIRLGVSFIEVAGVAAEKFTGVEAVIPDIWLPQSLRKLGVESGREAQMRVGGVWKEGVSADQAQAVLTASAVALSEALPADERMTAVEVQQRSVISRGDEMNAVAVGLVAFPFLLLLVVACANLASLHLAGASARQKELAIRMAIGASRPRLVRQLMTESMLLALIGAVAASVLAVASLRTLEAFVFQLMTRLGMNVTPVEADWRMIGVSILLAMVSAVLFGLAPSLEATEDARGRGGSLMARGTRPSRMRRGLLVAQTAGSLILLVLAGVLVENANRFDLMDAGFRTEGFIESGYEGKELAAYAKSVERVSGVGVVSGVGRVPLRGIMHRQMATVDGRRWRVFFNYTDERYLEAAGIGLVEGRGFTVAEARNQLPVAVVSQATARRLWPGRAAVGQMLELEENKQLFEVIGVARDVVSSFFFIGLDPTMVYLPAAVGSAEIGNLLVRIDGRDSRVVAELQKACLGAVKDSYCEPARITDIAGMQRLPVRIASQVALALGVVSMVLSCVGLYGVVAFVVERRRKEAGIRLALGAPRWRVMAAMAGASLRSVVLGVGLGLPACYVAAKMGESLAEYLKFSDTGVFVGAPMLLLGVALIAAILPARRAAGVDAAEVLREE